VSGFASNLWASFSITAPILVVLLLGTLFRRGGLVGETFVENGNRLLFNVCMPALLFLATASNSLSLREDLPLAAFGVGATFVVVLLLWLVAPAIVTREQRGVFVQSAFRSNMGMIGLALCLNAYGEEVLARAGLFVAAMIIAYNVLSIIILTNDRGRVLRNLARNPILLGVLSGLAWQQLQLPLPQLFELSISYLARMALPLALICIGAALEWNRLRPGRPDILWASGLKMVILPAAITVAAVQVGFRGQDLGILFLMVASPTAMVAFVMARELAPRNDMTAEVIALTTLVMPVTITLGLTVLTTLGLMN